MKKGEKIRLYLFALLAVLLILTAVFGERLAPFDPLESDFTASLLPPGGEHLCGTESSAGTFSPGSWREPGGRFS